MQNTTSKTKRNWTVYFIENDIDQKIYPMLLPAMVDAHTDGLYRYNSLELQFTVKFPIEYVGLILNSIGDQIANGRTLKDGDFVKVPLFEHPMKIMETLDYNGNPIFRVIIRDEIGNWPEHSNEYPYNVQHTSPYKEEFVN